MGCSIFTVTAVSAEDEEASGVLRLAVTRASYDASVNATVAGQVVYNGDAASGAGYPQLYASARGECSAVLVASVPTRDTTASAATHTTLGRALLLGIAAVLGVPCWRASHAN